MQKQKVLVAMSGGVDSSVAAWLLKQQGYDCIGVTMKLYGNETLGSSHGSTCCSLADVEDARSVAFRIGIPYYVFNFAADFEREVIQRFAAGYERGDTPNPCIDCNRYLKFARLFHRAQELGCDFIATGHYAQVCRAGDGGLYQLKTASDAAKDQSYVLYPLTQQQLAHTLLPLGALSKPQVRQIAAAQGFLNAHKRDSQDICFVPDGDYAAFLERYRGAPYPPGAFVDAAGRVLGQHRGFVRYTRGQRRGLGISADAPLYVTGKNPAANTVTLGPQDALLTRSFAVGDINWIAGQWPKEPFRAQVCTRYHAAHSPALILPGETGFTVVPDEPLRAATPGQAAVFYRQEVVLGGGVIRLGITR